MKRSTGKRPHKIVLRRETVASLEPRELRRVAGGGEVESYWRPLCTIFTNMDDATS